MCVFNRICSEETIPVPTVMSTSGSVNTHSLPSEEMKSNSVQVVLLSGVCSLRTDNEDIAGTDMKRKTHCDQSVSITTAGRPETPHGPPAVSYSSNLTLIWAMTDSEYDINHVNDIRAPTV